MNSKSKTENAENPQKSRRDAAKAVVAGAASAVWHKPVLNTVISPAHATMSPEPMVDQIVTTAAASTVQFQIGTVD